MKKVFIAISCVFIIGGCTTISKGVKIAGDNICINKDTIVTILLSKNKIAEANAVVAFCDTPKATTVGVN